MPAPRFSPFMSSPPPTTPPNRPTNPSPETSTARLWTPASPLRIPSRIRHDGPPISQHRYVSPLGYEELFADIAEYVHASAPQWETSNGTRQSDRFELEEDVSIMRGPLLFPATENHQVANLELQSSTSQITHPYARRGRRQHAFGGHIRPVNTSTERPQNFDRVIGLTQLSVQTNIGQPSLLSTIPTSTEQVYEELVGSFRGQNVTPTHPPYPELTAFNEQRSSNPANGYVTPSRLETRFSRLQTVMMQRSTFLTETKTNIERFGTDCKPYIVPHEAIVSQKLRAAQAWKDLLSIREKVEGAYKKVSAEISERGWWSSVNPQFFENGGYDALTQMESQCEVEGESGAGEPRESGQPSQCLQGFLRLLMQLLTLNRNLFPPVNSMEIENSTRFFVDQYCEYSTYRMEIEKCWDTLRDVEEWVDAIIKEQEEFVTQKMLERI